MEELTLDKKYLTKKNIFSFAFAGFGQNLVIGLVNSYILFFYTDILIIGAVPTAVLMIVARIWDAFNDPIMGTIVDKTRTRWGKMRPYILFITVPLILSTISLFIIPSGFSKNAIIAYAYITYFLFDIVYTICDVPFWGLASAMTPNSKERVGFISFSRLIHSIGGALPLLIVPVMIGIFGNTRGYTAAGIFVGLIGGGLFILAFTGTEERCKSTEKAPSIKECVKFLGVNRPLQLIVLANVMGFMRALAVPSGMYIATYVIKSVTLPLVNFEMNGATLNTVMVAGWGVSGFLGMIITPFLCKKFNYKQIYLAASIFGAIISLAMFIGGANFYVIMIFMFLTGLPYGLVTNINYAMISESVDYVEWKTGQRAEGVVVSLQTLMNKLMTALQIGLISLALIVINFVEPLKVGKESIIREQSQFTLDGFFFIITILPMLGWLLSCIPMIFYKFVGKKRDEIYIELAKRRNIGKQNNAE